MPLNLDSCIAGVFTPGNIGASSGLTPVEPVVPSLDGAAPAVWELVSASDTLEAFFGELLHEASHAADSYSSTGGAVAVSIAEAATAVDTVYLAQVFNEAVGEVAPATDAALVHAPGVVTASLTEAAAATSTEDAALLVTASLTEAAAATSTEDATLPFISVAWDSATVTAVTLSNSDLTATNTGTTSANQGARVASASGKTSGKFYFEVTRTTSTGGGGNHGFGIGTTGSTYTTMSGSATVGDLVYMASGNIWANGSNSGSSLSTVGVSFVLGVAVDLGNRKIWFKKVSASPGNWNGSGSADPATNVGGVTIPAGTMVPFCTFGGSSGTTGNALTANFGASAFTGTVPSGFTGGWPI